MTAGCKFMVKITLCSLTPTYTLSTPRGSLSPKFSSVSLGPQGPPSIRRHSPQKARPLITAAILGASQLPFSPFASISSHPVSCQRELLPYNRFLLENNTLNLSFRTPQSLKPKRKLSLFLPFSCRCISAPKHSQT